MSTQISTITPVEIESFPQLPPEIRLMIWDLALEVTRLQPRVFEIKFLKEGPQLVKKSCPAQVPAMAHVNAEARAFVLSKGSGYDLITMCGVPVFFDWELDTVFCSAIESYWTGNYWWNMHVVADIIGLENVTKLKRLAVEGEEFKRAYGWAKDDVTLDQLREYTALEWFGCIHQAEAEVSFDLEEADIEAGPVSFVEQSRQGFGMFKHAVARILRGSPLEGKVQADCMKLIRNGKTWEQMLVDHPDWDNNEMHPYSSEYEDEEQDEDDDEDEDDN